MTRPNLALAAALLLTTGMAAASWSEPSDDYVSRYRTDLALDRYQAGQLGVVLPTYIRSNLYTAWRDVMLGTPGLPGAQTAAPNRAGGLAALERGRKGGWLDQDTGRAAYDNWRTAVRNASGREMEPARDADKLVDSYLNCPVGSYVFAAVTLNTLAARADATPARLGAWIANQRQVFKACGDDPNVAGYLYQRSKSPPAPPVPPAATEPLHWRQVSEYQLASFALYGEDYARSTVLFDRIGATEGHPQRAWGEYLALRSQARVALFIPGTQDERWKARAARAQEGAQAAAARLLEQEQKLAAIEARIARIVANPALAARHEDSRAIGRSMQASLTPAARFAQLGQLLDDPRADPYQDDRLGDWLTLADRLLDAPQPGKPDPRPAMRAATGFLDWIQTIQQCQQYQATRTCAAEQGHALEQWQRYAKEGNAAQARVWLMASAMLAGVMPPALEQASLKVAPGAPEYLTVRQALARHYRLARQFDQARALADAELAGRQLAASGSNAARNLYLQERFAVAASPADAARYLLRRRSTATDYDTGEQAVTKADAPAPREEIAADGQRWINSSLSAADLQALGADQSLPSAVRARLGVAAWMRFDLLGQYDAALKAAQQVEDNSTELAPVMRQYRALKADAARHHWMLVNAVKYALTPMPGTWRMADAYAQLPADEATASMWCKMPSAAGQPYEENTEVELAPPAPAAGDAADLARRDRELARLGALKTATGYLGDHVLQRVAARPNDPDLPWLLHVVVRSTRGGCLDDDAKALSKKAYTVLHQRYGKTEWAKKTPYFY